MGHIFLSYSTNDYIFAELLKEKLSAADIKIWRDSDQILAGDEWRKSIDDGISSCFAVLLVLSSSSSKSQFVTYEWASAMGKSKPIVPIRFEQSDLHPKIEPIQYLDFSSRNHLPWEELISRLRGVKDEVELSQDDNSMDDYNNGSKSEVFNSEHDAAIKKILGYLNARGYQIASFDRIRKRVDEDYSDAFLNEVIDGSDGIFKRALVMGNKPGIKKA